MSCTSFRPRRNLRRDALWVNLCAAVMTIVCPRWSNAGALPIAAMDSVLVGPGTDVGEFGSLLVSRARGDRLRNSGARAETAVLGTDAPLGGWNETTIAVDPNDPLHVACASLFELRVSTDGGHTWQPPVVPALPTTHFANGDPSLAFDGAGRLFWCYQGAPLASYFGATGDDEFIARCDPATGAILPGYPVNVTASIGLPGAGGLTHDKAWLAADCHSGSPFADRLYLVWTEFPPSGVEVTLTSRSSNQGLTWSPAVQLGSHGTGVLFLWPTHIAVAPNGDVYAAEHRQPGFLANAPDGISGFVNVYRSTDGGVTFPQQTQAFGAGEADFTFNVQTSGAPIPGTDFLLQGSAQPWVLADPNVAGRVYVVANDDPDNDNTSGDPANVYIAVSSDYGATWDPPRRVDSGPGTSFQVMPTAAIDPASGAIVVHYYDSRGGGLNSHGNLLLDVYAAVSVDGGLTFMPDFRINDSPFDPDAGARCRYNCGEFVSDVWAAGTGEACAVTTSGSFLSYNGSTWSAVPTTTTPKFGVWGSSSTDVFIVGAGGEIDRFNGSTVQPQGSPTTRNLYGIDGRGPSDIFAVGATGTIIHYNGSTWAVQSSGTLQDLHQVWANPTGDAIAVGRNGTVRRFNGTSWLGMSPGVTDHLLGVWGTSDSDFYVTSAQGGLYHWNGSAWSAVPTGLGLLTDVWGTSGSDIYTLGFGRVRHFDGGTWSPGDFSEHLLFRMHGSSPTNVFAAGEEGMIAHFDGAGWTPQANPAQPVTPTTRIGEYNGLAVAGGRSLAVWCGNTVSGSDPLDQQTLLDEFDTQWQLGVSVFDPLRASATVELERPSPNPSSGPFTVAYSLPRAAGVDLAVVDVTGRRIGTLIHGVQPAGRHVVSWNAAPLAAGIYFVRLHAGDAARQQRAVVVH
jgi:hypothetical protein